MNAIQFISAFGLGAIVTTLIQAWLSNRAEISRRDFQEKKESYVGLLDAYHRTSVETSEQAAKNFGYWQLRCELVAPRDVTSAIQELIDTNEDPEGRKLAHEHLKEALRKDLGVCR